METFWDKPLQAIPVEQAYFRRIALSLVLIVLAIFLFVIFNEEWCTKKNLLAISIFGLGLLPFVRWFYRGEGWNFPVFELVGLFYGVCFGLSSLLINEQISIVDAETRVPALELTFFGLLFSYWAYYRIGGVFFRSLQPLEIENPISYDSIVKNAWLIVWVYLLYRVFLSNYGETIVFIHQPLMALGNLSNGIIFTDVLTAKKNSRIKHVGLSIVIMLQLLIGLASGALAQIATVVVFFGLIYLNIKKRILIKTIVVFIIAFMFMNPIKSEMRSLTWQDSGSNNLNFIQKASIFIDLLSNPQSFSDIHSSSDSTLSRIDHAGLLAKVMSLSPDPVPYSWGKTYLSLFTIWVPRFLWGEKPNSSVGNEWAHWYGLLGENDYSTSFNLPWIVEFFVNFGIIGVLLGMFLCGLGFAWLKALLCSRQASTLEYAVGVAILNPLWYAESNFALAGGGLLISAITMYFYFKFFRFLSLK